MRIAVSIVVSCALFAACGGTKDEDPPPQRDAGAISDAEPPPLEDASSDAGRDSGPPPPCDVVAPTVCPDPMPRYADVSPIFAARCATCHNGQDGMWPLSTYQHVADWYGEIRAQMLACTMPPLDSGLTMPLEDRMKILEWIRCGFPR